MIGARAGCSAQQRSGSRSPRTPSALRPPGTRRTGRPAAPGRRRPPAPPRRAGTVESCLLVEVREVLARPVLVLAQVEVGPVGDPLELAATRTGSRTRRRSPPWRSGPARRPRGAGAGGLLLAGSRGRGYQISRSSTQYSNHFSSVSGSTKNSISICSNSRVRKMKLPGVISLRKDLPICATRTEPSAATTAGRSGSRRTCPGPSPVAGTPRPRRPRPAPCGS